VYVCVYKRVRPCILRSVYMISTTSHHCFSLCRRCLPLSAAAICEHVCVTTRLLPNVRRKFPLSCLTRSAYFLSYSSPKRDREERAEAQKKQKTRKTGRMLIDNSNLKYLQQNCRPLFEALNQKDSLTRDQGRCCCAQDSIN